MVEPVRWVVRDEDLNELTPERARELVVSCFFEAQRETFARAADALGREQESERLRQTVVSSVRTAFQRVGGNFDRPSKATITAAVEILARKATAWGTPAEVIEHHRQEIARVLAALPD